MHFPFCNMPAIQRFAQHACPLELPNEINILYMKDYKPQALNARIALNLYFSDETQEYQNGWHLLTPSGNLSWLLSMGHRCCGTGSTMFFLRPKSDHFSFLRFNTEGESDWELSYSLEETHTWILGPEISRDESFCCVAWTDRSNSAHAVIVDLATKETQRISLPYPPTQIIWVGTALRFTLLSDIGDCYVLDSDFGAKPKHLCRCGEDAFSVATNLDCSVIARIDWGDEIKLLISEVAELDWNVIGDPAMDPEISLHPTTDQIAWWDISDSGLALKCYDAESQLLENILDVPGDFPEPTQTIPSWSDDGRLLLTSFVDIQSNMSRIALINGNDNQAESVRCPGTILKALLLD